MLTKKNVQDIILEELNNFLKDFGFKFKKSERAFINKNKAGFHRIGVRVLDYQPQYWAEMSLQIRVEVLETIKSKFNEAYHNRSKNDKSAVSDMIQYKSLNGEGYIKGFYTEEDAKKTAHEFISFIQASGFAYFSTYSKVENLYLKRKERLGLLKDNLETDARTALSVLTLAKLTGDTDYFTLVEFYTKKAKYLPEDDTNALPSVQALIKYLETVQPIKS